MRIVHWDEMFHPSFGYQINVLTKFQAKQGHEIIIVTSENINKHPAFSPFKNTCDVAEEDELFQRDTGIKVIRLPNFGVYSGRVIFKKGYIDLINSLKPDILLCHTHDTLSGISISKYAPKAQFPIVFDSHMLEMASKNPLNKLFRLYYRSVIAPIFRKEGYVVIRTQDDPYVEKCLGIPLTQAPFISFGTDTELFKPDKKVRESFRQNHNLTDSDFVVIYTGKLNEAKGGILLADAFREKFNTDKNVILIVVGNSSGAYGKCVEEIFTKSQNRILRFPTQKYSELAKFYQASDLSVFPKQCSLSFYDAQACGLPVISEDNNINKDRLKHGNGFNFIAGDVTDFREKVLSCINMNAEKYGSMKQSAYNYVKDNYDYKEIARQYTSILLNEVEIFEKKHCSQ